MGAWQPWRATLRCIDEESMSCRWVSGEKTVREGKKGEKGKGHVSAERAEKGESELRSD
jgi:hypothetical protein